MKTLDKELIISIHSQLISTFGGSDGIKDENMLESAINAPFQTFSGEDLFPTIYQKAARLGFGLVSNHPFIDGNGRTSRLVMNMELMRSGYVPVIIKKDNRLKYYEALDKAHTTGDYTDFVKLVTEAENEMLDRYLEVL